MAPSWGNVGGDFLEKLAALQWPNAVVPLTRVRMAALISQQISCPVAKIKDGRLTLLRESDLDKLTNAKALGDVQKAENMMEQMRVILEPLRGMTKADKLKLVAQNDARLVNHLLKKGSASKETCQAYPKHPASPRCREYPRTTGNPSTVSATFGRRC